MKATVSDMSQLFWKNKLWTEANFDYALCSITKYNVESVYMQLIASGVVAKICSEFL